MPHIGRSALHGVNPNFSDLNYLFKSYCEKLYDKNLIVLSSPEGLL